MKRFHFLTLAFSPSFGFTQAAISLGAASTYGSLSYASITNVGPTEILGDIGTTGTSITGFPPGTYSGSKYVASQAMAAFEAAGATYQAVAALPGAIVLTGNLGNRALGPGIYEYPSSAQLSGLLTLVGTGSPNDAWYFQIGSTLTTTTDSSVEIIGGGAPCNVYWQVGTSAVLGINSNFVGNILAAVSITANAGTIIQGALFALGASITLSNNLIQAQSCSEGDGGPISSGISSSSRASSSTASSSSAMLSSSSAISSSISSFSTVILSSTVVSSSATASSAAASSIVLLSSAMVSSSSVSSSLISSSSAMGSSSSSASSSAGTSSSTFVSSASPSLPASNSLSSSSSAVSPSSSATAGSFLLSSISTFSSSTLTSRFISIPTATSRSSSTLVASSTFTISSGSNSTTLRTLSSAPSMSPSNSATPSTSSFDPPSSKYIFSSYSGGSEIPTTMSGSSIADPGTLLTTSTVCTTSIYTVSKCHPYATDCYIGSITTEIITLYTTVCPVKPSPTPPPGYTISTIYTTKVYTITKCLETVTNCPIGLVTTEILSLHTTICPIEPLPTPPPGFTISTIYTTTIYTITKCHLTIPNCPIGSVRTDVLSLYTTVSPIVAFAAPNPQFEGIIESVFPSGASPNLDSQSDANPASTLPSALATPTQGDLAAGEASVLSQAALYTVLPVEASSIEDAPSSSMSTGPEGKAGDPVNPSAINTAPSVNSGLRNWEFGMSLGLVLVMIYAS